MIRGKEGVGLLQPGRIADAGQLALGAGNEAQSRDFRRVDPGPGERGADRGRGFRLFAQGLAALHRPPDGLRQGLKAPAQPGSSGPIQTLGSQAFGESAHQVKMLVVR